MDTDMFVERLVLKCICDQTGEEPDEVAAAGVIDLPDNDYLGVVNRIEGVFDCTLDLLDGPRGRLVVSDLCARVRPVLAGAGG